MERNISPHVWKGQRLQSRSSFPRCSFRALPSLSLSLSSSALFLWMMHARSMHALFRSSAYFCFSLPLLLLPPMLFGHNKYPIAPTTTTTSTMIAVASSRAPLSNGWMKSKMCREIRELGYVTRARARARFTQPTHVFSCISVCHLPRVRFGGGGRRGGGRSKKRRIINSNRRSGGGGALSEESPHFLFLVRVFHSPAATEWDAQVAVVTSSVCFKATVRGVHFPSFPIW